MLRVWGGEMEEYGTCLSLRVPKNKSIGLSSFMLASELDMLRSEDEVSCPHTCMHCEHDLLLYFMKFVGSPSVSSIKALLRLLTDIHVMLYRSSGLCIYHQVQHIPTTNNVLVKLQLSVL